MTEHQWINNVYYPNGIKDDLTGMDNDYLEGVLKLLNDKIKKSESATQLLRKQRTGVIKYAFKNGLSAIKIGEILGMSRQSVYAIVEQEDK